ncbi:hypothetical protein V8C86DRAFT_450512 [Haematococcus lacustris]
MTPGVRNETYANWACRECGTPGCETPQVRDGPLGPKTLCNACGLRFMRSSNRQQKSSSKRRTEPARPDRTQSLSSDGIGYLHASVWNSLVDLPGAIQVPLTAAAASLPLLATSFTVGPASQTVTASANPAPMQPSQQCQEAVTDSATEPPCTVQPRMQSQAGVMSCSSQPTMAPAASLGLLSLVNGPAADQLSNLAAGFIQKLREQQGSAQHQAFKRMRASGQVVLGPHQNVSEPHHRSLLRSNSLPSQTRLRQMLDSYPLQPWYWPRQAGAAGTDLPLPTMMKVSAATEAVGCGSPCIIDGQDMTEEWEAAHSLVSLHNSSNCSSPASSSQFPTIPWLHQAQQAQEQLLHHSRRCSGRFRTRPRCQMDAVEEDDGEGGAGTPHSSDQPGNAPVLAPACTTSGLGPVHLVQRAYARGPSQFRLASKQGAVSAARPVASYESGYASQGSGSSGYEVLASSCSAHAPQLPGPGFQADGAADTPGAQEAAQGQAQGVLAGDSESGSISTPEPAGSEPQGPQLPVLNPVAQPSRTPALLACASHGVPALVPPNLLLQPANQAHLPAGSSASWQPSHAEAVAAPLCTTPQAVALPRL